MTIKVEFRKYDLKIDEKFDIVIAVFLGSESLIEDHISGYVGKEKDVCVEIYAPILKHGLVLKDMMYKNSSLCSRKDYLELLQEMNSIGYDLLDLIIINEEKPL